MSGYAKLYSDIVESSIWDEDPDILKVWIALLALADSEGFVRGNPAWLAFRCKIDPARCSLALQKFESPDPQSRTQSAEGRRIKTVDRGWLILNYIYFRNSRGTFDPITGKMDRGKVYYAAEPDGKEIKIGFSVNPWARVSELQVARPRMRIVATEPGTFETERMRHEQFSAFRKEGEWFTFSTEILEFVRSLESVVFVATPPPTGATPAYASASVQRDRGTGERGHGLSEADKVALDKSLSRAFERLAELRRGDKGAEERAEIKKLKTDIKTLQTQLNVPI